MEQDFSKSISVNPKMKMADLLARYHRLIKLFPRMGISLGFGEKTVGQVCGENNIPVPFFVLLCRVYLEDGYVPQSEELAVCAMEDIMRYLEASHKDYLEYEFPHIEHHLQEIVSDWNEKYKLLILNFFSEYKKEIVAHFKYEEEVIFPFIRSHQPGAMVCKCAARKAVFDKQHAAIEDKLSDFTNLLIKYIPADIAQRERVDMLLDIYVLSRDLTKHAQIEDRILIPYLHSLEHHES